VRRRDETGAALVLAIAFMLAVGAIGASVVSLATTAAKGHADLVAIRDQQYAADAAVERAVVAVRQIGGGGPGMQPCGGPYGYALNGVAIRVDCTNAPSVTRSGYLQRNVVFTACVDTDEPCTDDSTIIRAQVNYEGTGPEPGQISTTWVQSWSVHR